ncbi:carbohydrate ABC transporter permease [Paenibacillus sp. IB182496]|uniref:Carbohydrate ABC transporter permease n=1 Tax=Paenibacillus sabuli TaxID=2772509 RepID=A0A927BQ78_9BACL|nr:carbohydrate ABC transporter permease [Paenibacillus sabuli]MBD2844252.1 carbohydrate ABC transporter permease [Paenibacillus sabuli]
MERIAAGTNKTAYRLRRVLTTALLLLLGLVFLLPFIWMLSASFKPELEVFTYPIQWIPNNWNLVENYTNVWAGKVDFVLYYWNSIQVAVLTTLLSVLVSAMAAYGFTKIRFRGRNLLFLIVLATYMIPPEATHVPLFVIYRWMGLYDTHAGLILLGGFSVLGTFLLRQFFEGISNEYLESAQVDGAGHFTRFMRITLPLARPALATYGILRFIWTWNDFQTPFLFLSDKTLYTIQLGMYSFADRNGSFYALIMAASVSAIIPLLVVFIIGQKQVIEGISFGGLKG